MFLRFPDASKDVLFINNGVLRGFDLANKEPSTSEYKKGFVELITLDPGTSQTINEAVIQKGGRYLEAQCSGRRYPGSEEFLLILASGDKSLFADCESCFFAMGKCSLHLSNDVGVATKFNIVQSMVLGTLYAAIAESLSLVQNIGLEAPIFLDILSVTRVSTSEVIETGHDMIANRTDNLQHMQKNIDLALDLGRTVELSMPVTAAAGDAYSNCKLLTANYDDYDDVHDDNNVHDNHDDNE